MKNKFLKTIGVLCIAVTMALSMIGCGAKDSGDEKDTQKIEDTQATDDAAGTEMDAEGNVITSSMDAILKEIEGEDAYMVLKGIGASNGYAWAPTVLVLGNDETCYAMVDYAGQAIVNFMTGTYTVNADGSITTEGALYSTGEELVYEITKNADGSYTTTIDIPDAGASVTLTGTPE